MVYLAFHTFPEISASIIALLSETLKFCIAIFFLLRHTDLSLQSLRLSISTLAKPDEADLRRIGRYALPAALYLVNNLIYNTVLPFTTPSMLQVCILAKLPTTGIMHHYMIKPQRNVLAWISLLVLCIGLVVFNIPSGPAAVSSGTWYLAPLAGFIIACLSALASISTEKSTKEAGFWESQAYLYVWGIFFAILSYPLMPSVASRTPRSDENPFRTSEFTFAIAGLVIITAGTGLVVAVILRAKDNILKLIGIAVSLVTVAATQYFLLPDLSGSTFTPWKVFGGGTVAISTWCYNHYCQEPWPSTPEEADDLGSELLRRASLQDDEEKFPVEAVASSSHESIFQPTLDKVVCGFILTAFFTYEVALRASR